MPSGRLHPVFRYAGTLLCVLTAGATAGISWAINPHSAAWLAAFYGTAFLCLTGLRNGLETPLQRAYLLYQLMLNQYLLAVWFVHVYRVPERGVAVVEDIAFPFRIVAIGSYLLPVALFQFVAEFSQCRARWLRWTEFAGWAAGLFFLAVSLFDKICLEFLWTGETWVPNFNGWYPPFFVYVTLYVWMGLGLGCVQIFRIRDDRRRLQLMYWLAGALPAWLSCWAHFLISMGVPIYPVGGFVYLAHALLMAYAVRQRVFPFTLVVRRGLVYAIFSLLVGVLYAGTLWLAGTQGGVPATLLSPVLFVGIVALLQAPFLSMLQRAVDRSFFREESDRRRMLERYTREAAALIGLEPLAQSITAMLSESVHPRRISLYLDDGSGTLRIFGVFDQGFVRQPWPKSDVLPADLQSSTARVFETVRVPADPIAAAATGGAVVRLTEGFGALVTPILHRGLRLGVLHLEPRRADEPYSAEDVRWVETVAAHSSLALQNARAFADVERMEHFTRQMLESLTTGVLVVGQDGRIQRANRAARLICGPDPEVFPEDLNALAARHPALAEELRSALDAGTVRENRELLLELQPPVHLLLSTRPLSGPDGEGLLLAILHDISGYKSLEAAARQRESLARVGETISSINHEIKNILQPIRFQVERLQRIQMEDRVFSRAMSVIPDRLGALDRMLGNLANLSRPIEIRPRPLLLSEVVDGVFRDIRELAVARGAELRADVPPELLCHADRHWLPQVLFNLVRNGAEACAGRSPALVSVVADETEAETRIRVVDTGAGVGPEAQAKLFEPFYSTKGESGNGLGLSISRKVVELHGGRIEVDGRQGEGARFTVVLPRKNAATPAKSLAH